MVEKIEPISMRTFYGATVIGFNIYVIVGCSRYDDFNTCHCFNSVAKTWCEVSHMHERRGYLSVAVLDELMYAMGGCCNGRTAERYDHRTNRWSMIAPMNEKRSCSSAAALNGKIYIAGGWCNSAEVYDPDDNKWTLIESMLFSRTFFSCIAYHGYVYAIGGSNSETGSTGEKYNPTTNKWVQIPNMSQPRPHCGIAVIDNKIFTIGEVPLYTKSISVECYDDKSNKWIAARGIEVDRNISCLSACVVKGLPNICDYVKI
jgi:kelch-like protein 10